MASKATLTFLVVCYIYYTIDSGCSIRCFQTCVVSNPNCEGGTKMNCSSDEKHCASYTANRNGQPTIEPHCLKETELTSCQTSPYCDPCNEKDLCNDPNKK